MKKLCALEELNGSLTQENAALPAEVNFHLGIE
jgi:hypothetical protein